MTRMIKAIIMVVALLGTSVSGVKAQTLTARPKLNIAVLVFPKAQVIDYSGPMEVFTQFSQGPLPHNIYTVGENSEPITTNGLVIKPDYTFSNNPKPDVLIIPGGGGAGLLKDQINDPVLIKWIQDNAKEAKYVLSVCNGAFILAKTGLLDGLTATTTAGLTNSLATANPKVKIVSDQRYVDNGKFITSAGLSSGIDASLHIIEKLYGKAWARAVAMGMEYNWQPDSGYVRAQLADLRMPGSLYKLVMATGAFLIGEGGTDSWQDEWSLRTPASAAEFLSQLNSGLVTEDKWSRLEVRKEERDAATSEWKFVDDRGADWNGTVNVRAGSRENELVVSVVIARSGRVRKG